MGIELAKERNDYASIKRKLAIYIESTIQDRGAVKIAYLQLQSLRQFGLGERAVNGQLRLMHECGTAIVDWEMGEVRSL
jgi:hypothetical protein